MCSFKSVLEKQCESPFYRRSTSVLSGNRGGFGAMSRGIVRASAMDSIILGNKSHRCTLCNKTFGRSDMLTRRVHVVVNSTQHSSADTCAYTPVTSHTSALRADRSSVAAIISAHINAHTPARNPTSAHIAPMLLCA